MIESNQTKLFLDGPLGKVCGVLHKVNNNKEIAIIVHGFGSSKETSAIPSSQVLNGVGVNALRIDLDNQGESELDFKTNVSIPKYITQIEVAINYAKKEHYEHISLIGTSFGALAVFATALSHPEISKLVLRAPVVDFQKHMIRKFGKEEIRKNLAKGTFPHKRRNGSSYEFTADAFTLAKEYSLFDHAKEINIPTLIIQGTEDKVVEWELTKEVVNLFPHAKLHLIKGAKHNLGVNNDFEESKKVLANFYKS